MESSEAVRRRYPGETGLGGVFVVVVVAVLVVVDGEVGGNMMILPLNLLSVYYKDRGEMLWVIVKSSYWSSVAQTRR